MKNLYILTALLLCSPALAQSTNFFGPSGAYEGSAYTTGGATNYYGPSGQYLGNSYTNSGSTNYYSPSGAYEGSSYGHAIAAPYGE